MPRDTEVPSSVLHEVSSVNFFPSKVKLLPSCLFLLSPNGDKLQEFVVVEVVEELQETGEQIH